MLYKLICAALAVGLFSLSVARAQEAVPYTIITIEQAQGVRPYPLRINNNTEVAGSRSFSRAFLYSGGKFTDLSIGFAPSFKPFTPSGINIYGQIVGGMQDAAFLYSDGRFTNLGNLEFGPFSFIYPASINDSGHVVGLYFSHSRQMERAFIYADGKLADLGDIPNMVDTVNLWAWDINNRNQVVGIVRHISGGLLNERGFLWEDGVFTRFGTLGGIHSWPRSINDAGQIVGDSELAEPGQQKRAFLYQDGEMRNLGLLPGAAYSKAHSINNAGQIVGESGPNSSDIRAFLYSDGVMRDLNDLLPPNSGWVLQAALDINDRGQIVGHGTKDGVPEKAFILSPASELLPVLLTEEDSDRALALDSVTLLRGPFRLANEHNFSADKRTRVTLFARNVDLLPGESSSIVTVQAEDSQHVVHELTVESVARTKNYNWMTQVVVRLPDELAGAGDVLVSLKVRGVETNRARMTILPSP